MTSESTIALAEFLPEATRLTHLDLTDNPSIDAAGIMALAASIKMNYSVCCLDINIPVRQRKFFLPDSNSPF
jgi:protein phosphatase 1 regulatory subunit 37